MITDEQLSKYWDSLNEVQKKNAFLALATLAQEIGDIIYIEDGNEIVWELDRTEISE